MLSLSLFWNTAFSSAHSVWRERKEKGREKEEGRQEGGKYKFLVIQFLFGYTLLSSLLIPSLLIPSPFLLRSHFPTPSLPILINLPLPASPLLSIPPLSSLTPSPNSCGTEAIPAERWCSWSCYHQSEGSGNTAQTTDSAFSAEQKTAVGLSYAQEKIWIPYTDLSLFSNHLHVFRNSLGTRR